MKFFIFLFFLLPFKLIAYNYVPGDSLYVISFYGTPLYKQASQDSKIVAIVAVGSGVKVMKKDKSDFYRVDTDTFLIKGNWVRVNYKGHKGFVFDGNCINFPIVLRKAESSNGILQEPVDPLGKLIDIAYSERIIETEFDTYSLIDTFKIFQRGIYHFAWDIYGCYHETYTLTNSDFNQMYHFFNAINNEENTRGKFARIMISKLIAHEGDSYYFSEINGRTDIKISFSNTGFIKLSWTVCP